MFSVALVLQNLLQPGNVVTSEGSCGNEGPDTVHDSTTTPTPSHTVHQEVFGCVSSAHKQELLVPLLAFWKCHPIYPEAFQPVKLSQRCKAETLMKCINLERRASVLITVWFVYEPLQQQRRTRRRLRWGVTEQKTVHWPVHPYITITSLYLLPECK